MKGIAEFFSRSQHKAVGLKFWGIVLLLFVSCFILTSVVSTGGPIGEPFAEPIRQPHGIVPDDRDGVDRDLHPDFFPDSLVLGGQTGDIYPTVSQPEDSRLQEMVMRKDRGGPSLPWVVWLEFLLPLLE